MKAPAKPNGRVLQLVESLEDNNQRLVEENINLRQQVARLKAEATELHKEVMDIEAERDDWIKECASERTKRETQRNATYEQVKAEFERKYQVLDILLSTMDHDTWFSIIASREDAYQSRVQKHQLELQVKVEEVERLREANRQSETEMKVLRSFCTTLQFAMSPN
jgi:hypothetical protein